MGASQVRDRVVDVTMIDPTPLDKLDQIEKIEEPIQPPDPVTMATFSSNCPMVPPRLPN